MRCIQRNVEFLYVRFWADGEMEDWLMEQRIFKFCAKAQVNANGGLWCWFSEKWIIFGI